MCIYIYTCVYIYIYIYEGSSPCGHHGMCHVCGRCARSRCRGGAKPHPTAPRSPGHVLHYYRYHHVYRDYYHVYHYHHYHCYGFVMVPVVSLFVLFSLLLLPVTRSDVRGTRSSFKDLSNAAFCNPLFHVTVAVSMRAISLTYQIIRVS